MEEGNNPSRRALHQPISHHAERAHLPARTTDVPNLNANALQVFEDVVVDAFHLEEALELAEACWVADFAERLGFDLADAFAGDAKLAADLFEGAGVAIGQAEAKFEDLAFALAEAGEDIAELGLKKAERGF